MLDRVTRRFGGVVALDGVELTVRAGTIHGLIGPNGSGKTTALNVIGGLYRPDGGRVLFGGRPIQSLPPHRRARLGIARTFQNLRLFGDLSVLRNVQVGQHVWFRPPLVGTLLGLPVARRLERQSAVEAATLAAEAGVDDVLHVPAGDLPHGRQRQLELARALAARPKMLLLDEPAAGLSGAEVADLRARLLRARADGITILLVEHHVELVLDLCDRVTVLDHGRVIADGTPAEVRADVRVAAAYLGSGEQIAVRPTPARQHAYAVPSPLLAVRGLGVRYGPVTAVDGLDLEVGEGEIVALLGANGAGKTSVLRAISGLVGPSDGTIQLEGRPIERVSAERRVALGLAHVPEGRLVFGDQSVEDNLRLGAFGRAFRAGRSEIEGELERLLARFPSLRERRTTPAGALSGGEQQQLAIARALMGRPRVLLLDEPSLGLAPLLVEQVFEMIAGLRDEGVAVLLVEQLAYRSLQFADRAYVLRTGRCVLSGASADVAADSRLERAYLGE